MKSAIHPIKSALLRLTVKTLKLSMYGSMTVLAAEWLAVWAWILAMIVMSDAS